MLHGWDNFFMMAGTAAATLIGLLFVAVTVGTGFSASSIVHGSRGFLTPTLIRFGGVLPDWHDWLPYVGIPALGSASLIVGAVGLLAERSFAPYAIAGATVLLLFAGIYGAWDLTLWMIKNREKT